MARWTHKLAINAAVLAHGFALPLQVNNLDIETEEIGPGIDDATHRSRITTSAGVFEGDVRTLLQDTLRGWARIASARADQFA
jgi:hypothetical protein